MVWNLLLKVIIAIQYESFRGLCNCNKSNILVILILTMLLISSHGRKVLSSIPGGDTEMGYDGLNGLVHKTF